MVAAGWYCFKDDFLLKPQEVDSFRPMMAQRSEHQRLREMWDSISRQIDDCLYSMDRLKCLEELYNQTGDRVAAMVLSKEYEKTHGTSSESAWKWRSIALEELSPRDRSIITHTADALVHHSHHLSRPKRAAQAVKPLAVYSTSDAYGRLAEYVISEFNRMLHHEYVVYFGRMGFTAETILDPVVLFRFMSIISYDMRPLSYQQVWGPPNHPEYDGNSVRQALQELGVDLDVVKGMDAETLQNRLQGKTLNVRGTPFQMRYHQWTRTRIDHSRGLKDLASKTEEIAHLLKDLPKTKSVQAVYHLIDSVYGFGSALTSKTLLFIIRCFGIGLAEAKPEDLRIVANGLLNELVVRQRAELLRVKGVEVTALLEHLTRLGDPLAIELLYLLDDETDLADLVAEFNHAENSHVTL